MKPVVAIVGRPNVGKSTFFNRITRSRDALVDDFPGVTRDRHYGDAIWNDVAFTLIDTGGFAEADEDRFADMIKSQIFQAMADADVIIHLLDGKAGLSPFDRDIVKVLREAGKPVFYAVNKIDGPEQEGHMYDFFSLGLDQVHPLSAEHGFGINDMMDDVVKSLPSTPLEHDGDMVRVAVVGRPNVGKSSLINRIMGEERQLVSDVPGTTRDAVDTVCRVDGKSYLIIDTAGIRKKGKVKRKLEKFSIIKALRSLDRCDVALVMVDAHAGITDQDISIAGYAYDRGCGCVFLLNKWDLLDKDDQTFDNYCERLMMEAKFLNFAPVISISALTGQRVNRIFATVDRIFQQYTRRISTAQVNAVFKRAMEKNEPSLHRGRRIKFYYATQISTRPPTFVCFVNYPQAVHFSYKRYLINQLRESADFGETPLRLIFRKRESQRKMPAGKKIKGKRKKR